MTPTPKSSINKNELQTLLCKLVSTQSENPPGDTSALAEVCKEHLSKHGLSTQQYESKKGHISLLSTIGKSNTLTLAGHLDTVPVGSRSKWRYDPFEAKVVGGRVYGRGAADMKGGVAAIISAFTSLVDHEPETQGITLALFCDEEVGGGGGAGWITSRNLLSTRMMIIAEPSNSSAGRVIIAGERGTLWVKAVFDGKPAHGSLPMLGSNAILTTTSALQTLQRLTHRKVTTPSEARPLIRSGREWLLKRFGKSVGAHEAIDHYTMNVGLIEGGTSPNTVADECSVEVDFRIPAGGSKEAFMQEIRESVGKAQLKVLNECAPSFTDPTHPLVTHLQNTVRKVADEEAPAVYAPYTTDAHFIRERCNAAVVSFGPGDLAVIHRYNEYVSIEDAVTCAKIFHESALSLSRAT